MHRTRRRGGLLLALSVLATLTALAGSPGAGAQSQDAALERASQLQLDRPITGALPEVDRGLSAAEGDVRLSIRGNEPALSAGGSAAAIRAEHAQISAAVRAAGGTIDGSVDRVLNAVFATVDVSAVEAIVGTGAVSRVSEVADYQLDLSDTVPYIGGTAVQNGEVGDPTAGEGILVAVLDSGVDYTHADLGGPGTLDAYEAAHGENCVVSGAGTLACDTENFASRDGLFPTPKVVEGFDFVGEEWPFGPRTEDDDPIDYEGHGTHVADIAAGRLGVAPGADILAVKVCSAVSSSCNGVALILGVEYAVDQGADIMNMSLGADYGSAFDDDLSLAVDNATLFENVLTVSSAGNGSNKPYITGTPSSAPTALAVAQTAVPSAVLPFLTVLDGGNEVASIESVFQDWSLSPAGVVGGPLQYADGAGGNLLGCDPFAPDSLTGLVVLVDRGACSFTAKIANIANAGGAVGIIGLVAPGDPFTGGFDGAACDPDGDGELNCDDIPGYMISQADSNGLKAAAAAGLSLEVDPANGVPLAGTMVGSSSRGPSLSFNNLIKPEIGAPGASISAEAGTGDGTTPFGGTSGASPVVAGAAALVMADDPSLSALQVRALLVNTGETDILTGPGQGLAPITRIGGGEVRVDRAVAASAAAWESSAVSPTLSFGFVEVSDTYSATQEVTVENYGGSAITYDLGAGFRYANDEANGAVTPSLSTTTLTVPAGGSATFEVTLDIDASALRPWIGDSGGSGANPAWLDLLEYDGYVTLDAAGDADDLHVPWHVLPRRAADVVVEEGKAMEFTLTNQGESTADMEIYNLISTSADLPEGPRGGQAPTPDIRATGVAFYEVPSGFCASELLVAFAVNSWEPQTHANAPAYFGFEIDVDGDRAADYAVFNLDLSLLLQGALTLGDGRNVVYAQDLNTGDTSVFFFTDHDTNSGNTVMLACGEQIGLDADILKKRQVGVAFAADLYFGGPGDFVEFDFGAGLTKPPVRIGNETLQFLELGTGESATLRLFANNSSTDGALVLVRGGAIDEAIILQK